MTSGGCPSNPPCFSHSFCPSRKPLTFSITLYFTFKMRQISVMDEFVQDSFLLKVLIPSTSECRLSRVLNPLVILSCHILHDWCKYGWRELLEQRFTMFAPAEILIKLSLWDLVGGHLSFCSVPLSLSFSSF